MTGIERSREVNDLNCPPMVPMGVLQADTITTLFDIFSLLCGSAAYNFE
jgi:hypothetical protein